MLVIRRVGEMLWSMNNNLPIKVQPMVLLFILFCVKVALPQEKKFFEAEDAILSGTTEIVNCSSASGQKMVKGFSTGTANAVLFDNLKLDEAGEYFITVSYFAVSQRNITYELNDNNPVAKSIPASGVWCYQGGIPADFTFRETLREGANQLLFYDGPIIDKIVISEDTAARKAATFYLSSFDGSDENDGLTPGTAWKTIEKVNSLELVPGDSVLFKAGQTITGKLTVMNEGGIAGSPIIFSSYDEGEKPTLDGNGHLSTVNIINSGHLHFFNLEIKNDGGPAQPGDPEDLRYGIYFENTKNDGTVYSHYRLKNLVFKNIYPTENVTDDDRTGVNAHAINTSGSWGDYENPSRFSDMIIEDCFFTRTARHATFFKAVDSLTIRNNLFENVGGAGMVIGNNCSNILVEHNTTNYTGSSIDGRMAGRGSGIWCFRSKNLTVQHNKFMHAKGIKDSYGMHIDIGNRNVVYQYNYSEGNEGGFVEILGENVNIGYRYNLSVGDGWRTRGTQHGKIFWISGWSGDPNNPTGSDSVFIYNNSIYVSDSIAPDIKIVSVTKNTRIYNNIISVANQFGSIQIENDRSLNDFNNNIWFGNIPVTDEDGETYRGANALTSDPLFNNEIATDSTGFKLQTESPAVKAGKLIFNSEVSVSFDYFHNNGGADFYGNEVSFSESPNIGAYNGAGIRVNAPIIEKVGKQLKVYPNPAKDFIHLEGIDDLEEIQILSVYGKLVKRIKANKKLDISDLNPGVYILKNSGYQPFILIKAE